LDIFAQNMSKKYHIWIYFLIGVLSFSPIFGLSNLTWLGLGHLCIIAVGLLVLMIGYQKKKIPKNEGIKILSFLYLNYLVVSFLPSENLLYNRFVIVCFGGLIVWSLIFLYTQKNFLKKRFEENLLLSQLDKWVVPSLLFLFIFSFVKIYFIRENTSELLLGLGKWGMAIVLYFIVGVNAEVFGPKKFGLKNGFPYFILSLAFVAFFLGISDILKTLNWNSQAITFYDEKKFTQSAALFIKIEKENQFEIPLRRVDYLQLSRKLMAIDGENREDNIDRAIFFLNHLVQEQATGRTDSLNEEILQEYLKIGDLNAALGRLEESQSIYQYAAVLSNDPLKILRYLYGNISQKEKGEIGNKEPYISLQDFEVVESPQLVPWTHSGGLSLKTKQHILQKEVAHSGQRAEYLAVEYDLDPSIGENVYDYWAIPIKIPKPDFPVGIRAFIRGKKGQDAQICLVINYIFPGDSGASRSEIFKIDENWKALTFRDLNTSHPGVYLYDKIGINTFGNNTELFIDDIQIFTYR
jgi:tetratricopeptide (TPR) repeat protein